MKDKHNSHKGKGPWGPLTFLASLARLALDWYRHL